MPKLIDYPRTSYTGAWEVAEIVDDTGGKCALETSARKLNRKVSGSFKAIVGSAVKFGLLTSKREVLTTTTLFRRIKHAYDKQEELIFHREAFLNPPLFTQLCRKFRARELPVAMLDVLLMREFDVEEINAQSVAKAFTDGARMVGLLNEDNILADIDQLAAQQPPRRELASPTLAPNVFRQSPTPAIPPEEHSDEEDDDADTEKSGLRSPSATAIETPEASPTTATQGTNATPGGRMSTLPPSRPAPAATADAIANLFGLGNEPARDKPEIPAKAIAAAANIQSIRPPVAAPAPPTRLLPTPPDLPGNNANTIPPSKVLAFTINLIGPGMQTQLEVTDVEDLALVRGLLDKIERQLKK